MRACVLTVLLALAAVRGGAAQANADSVLDVLSSSSQLSTLYKYVQKVSQGGWRLSGRKVQVPVKAGPRPTSGAWRHARRRRAHVLPAACTPGLLPSACYTRP